MAQTVVITGDIISVTIADTSDWTLAAQSSIGNIGFKKLKTIIFAPTTTAELMIIRNRTITGAIIAALRATTGDSIAVPIGSHVSPAIDYSECSVAVGAVVSFIFA